MARYRRNPKLILVGVLALLVGGSILAWRSMDTSTTALVTTHDIVAGQRLMDSDVVFVKVHVTSGVAALGQSPTGQVALVDLPTGTLLVAGDVGWPESAPEDLVRLPVVVEAGLAPVWALHEASPITLCDKTGQLVSGVVASDPVPLADGASYRFDVWVGIEDAVLLARWVSVGSLVVVSP